jgi:hypothetical protein
MMTHREQFYKKFGLPKDVTLSIGDISILTGIKKSILQEVYNRGIGAWKSNISSVRLKGSFEKNPNTKKYPRSARLSKEQWAYGRLFAFVMKTKKVYYGADSDLAKENN